MFESILDGFTSGGMISGGGVSFDFDVVTVESHSSNLRLTENPVEKGSEINDHAILEPKEITITGVMVGYNVPPKLKPSSFGFDFPDFPLPFDVSPITDQAFEVANDFVGSTLSGAVGQAVNIGAAFMPDFKMPLGDFLGGDRVKNALEKLETIQKSGELLTVTTHSRQYENMMIISLVLDQDKEFSGEFSLTMKEVFIVESKIGEGLSVQGSDMPKQTSKGNAGNTQPKKVENSSSLANDGWNMLKGG